MSDDDDNDNDSGGSSSEEDEDEDEDYSEDDDDDSRKKKKKKKPQQQKAAKPAGPAPAKPGKKEPAKQAKQPAAAAAVRRQKKPGAKKGEDENEGQGDGDANMSAAVVNLAEDEVVADGQGRTDSAKKALKDKFQKLTQREHILLRPDTYVGSVEKREEKMWVWDGKRLVEREVTFVPALYKIVDEILVNAADNKQRDPSQREIAVTIDREKGRITVRNDGKGIPVELHQAHNLYIPEMVFGHLLTGDNFKDEEERTRGGRNGFGAKLTNIYSSEFRIETSDVKAGLLYSQVWTDNMQNCGKPKMTKAKTRDYTEVSFIPDFARFKMDGLDDDIMALLQKRVYDIAGVTPGIRVKLNGETLAVRSFEAYVKLYTSPPATTSTSSSSSSFIGEDGAGGGADEDGGVSPQKQQQPQDEQQQQQPTSPQPVAAAGPQNKLLFANLNDRWAIGVTTSKDGAPAQVSFTNSICTYKGGTHVQYVQDKLVKAIQEHIEKKHKNHASVVKPQQIKNHMWIFVNALIVNPSFDAQTKENLTTKPSAFGPKEFLPDIPEKFMTKIIKESGIVEQVLSWAAFKLGKQMENKLKGRKKVSILDIPKLDDANNAGGKLSSQCTLILTEGDSAKTLALSGISVVGRDNYGVFPLKGKLLNVRDAAQQQVLKNEEIQNLIKILGLRLGTTYTDTKDLRYGHVMIMTDQDQDGSHIKGLAFNFFDVFFPSLLQIPGFIQVFVTPLVKVTKGNVVKSFYSLREYAAWKQRVSDEARAKAIQRDPDLNEDALRALQVNALKAWRVKYYKGLGTNSSKEAQEYFAEIAKHSISMVYSDTARNVLEMAFAKNRVEDRKKWLSDFSPETFVPVDFLAGELDYPHFINGEMILFSLADNVRSIPSVLDGLKPSQRKVLYACFKRNLVNEIKVSQLSGYVSEHAAYHHGEESLSSTIVGMAQTFVGSNNIALLNAGGAFGTRRMGGKDNASPRYIFTSLTKLARAVFHPHDDALLKRVEDDGMFVEPESYVPIIPLLLVNGVSGIGTGWSTEVPSYDPRAIIKCLEARLDGIADQSPALHPFYKGFSGVIEEENTAKKGLTGRYLIRGKYELQGTKLRITELPVGKWTATYKEFLLKAAAGEVDGPADKAGGGGKGGGAGANKANGEGGAATGAQAAIKRPTFPEGAVKEIRENHTDETVDFELTLDEAFASELEKGGPEKINSLFQLQTTISITNMHAFDVNGRIRKFDRPEDILDAFYGRRLTLYGDRKTNLERELERECEKLSAQARFVRMIVDGELVVAKKKRKDLLRELAKRNFPRRFKTRGGGDGQQEEEQGAGAEDGEDDDTDDAAEEEDGGKKTTTTKKKKVDVDAEEEDDKSGKGYDYLLSMPIWSLTAEKAAKLQEKAKAKAMELDELRAKKPEDLWRADLRALSELLDEAEVVEAELRAAQEKTRRRVPKKGGGKKAPAKKTKKARIVGSDEDDLSESESEEEDEDDDEDDSDFEEKKPKRKPAAAAATKKPPPQQPAKPAAVLIAAPPGMAKPAAAAPVAASTSASPGGGKKKAAAAPQPKKQKDAKPPPPKKQKKSKDSDDDDDDDFIAVSDEEEVDAPPRDARPKREVKRTIPVQDSFGDDDDDDEEDDEEDEDEEEESPKPRKAKPAAAAGKKPKAASPVVKQAKAPSPAKPRLAPPAKPASVFDNLLGGLVVPSKTSGSLGAPMREVAKRAAKEEEDEFSFAPSSKAELPARDSLLG